MIPPSKAIAAVFAVLVIGLGLAACGGGSDSTSSSGGGAETEATGSEQASGGSGGGAAAAAAAIKPIVGKPGPFPVVDPLKEVPQGANIDYMDCGTPICALIWEVLTEAAETMGVDVSRIKAGDSANTVQPAFETVVEKKPDAVIVSGIDIQLWAQQAEELEAEGIPVVTAGPTGVEKYGVKSPQYAEAESEFSGKMMADYITAEMGEDSSVAFYNVPELPFSKIIGESLEAELEAVCPECSVRTVDIPVSTVGNMAPNTIVSDLQTNPDTTVAAFPTDEIEIGLPQALSAAGLEVKTLGNVPGPDNLQYLKEGKETAALGYDLAVAMWEVLDQAAREIVGQEITGPAGEGLSDRQFLTQKDITFDPSHGWTGYPDYKQRYEKLWGVGG